MWEGEDSTGRVVAYWVEGSWYGDVVSVVSVRRVAGPVNDYRFVADVTMLGAVPPGSPLENDSTSSWDWSGDGPKLRVVGVGR